MLWLTITEIIFLSALFHVKMQQYYNVFILGVFLTLRKFQYIAHLPHLKVQKQCGHAA